MYTTSQAIFVEIDSKMKRIRYNSSGTIVEEWVNILDLNFDPKRKWEVTRKSPKLLVVKLPKDNNQLIQIKPASKCPKIVHQDPQVLQEEKLNDLLEETQEDYMMSRKEYYLGVFYQYNTLPSEVEKLCLNSTWFEGVKKEIDVRKNRQGNCGNCGNCNT